MYECVIIIDVLELCDELCVFINLEIIWVSDEYKVWDEGCLFVFDIYDKVDCLVCVCVCVLNEKGEIFELEVDDLLVVCI